MTLTTSRGQTLEADFALPAHNRLHIRLADERPLHEIAAEIDMLESLTADGQELTGPFLLTALILDERTGRVTATLRKEG